MGFQPVSGFDRHTAARLRVAPAQGVTPLAEYMRRGEVDGIACYKSGGAGHPSHGQAARKNVEFCLTTGEGA